MLDFYHHPKFVEELDYFVAKSCRGDASVALTIDHHENLLNAHFCGSSPVYTPKHMGPAQGFGAYTVYWLHLIIPDGKLSRNQNPKCYLLKIDGLVSFLCLDSHIKNYKDSELRKTASKRLADILEILGSTNLNCS